MQPSDEHFPTIEQPAILDKARVSLPISMAWSVAVAIVIATIWAAKQWWSISNRLDSMAAAVERIEKNTRYNWTKQNMQVWTLESRRLNKDFSPPSINEVWDATRDNEK